MKYKMLFVLSLFAVTLWGQNPVSLIPEPEKMELLAGQFALSASVKLHAKGEEAVKNAGLFNRFLQSRYGLSLKNGSGDNSIRFITDTKMQAEAYQLIIEGGKITLRGNGAGLFYGVQTLQQLITGEQTLTLPNLKIEDSPRFAYRGLMLDVGRYFFSVDYLKHFLDMMAHYKLNVFHWHLTEDGGWRIEIKKYPQLTQKAAWRSSTQYGNKGEQDYVPHGGYYTQEQVKDLITYATERHILIIPEIEMPGHSMAAQSVFPELTCSGEPIAIPLTWGVKEDILCAGNDEVFVFLENVLSEVIDLFPSKYIHVGGDEAPRKHWQQCPKCQARIRAEGLKDEHALQNYFMRRIEKFVNSKGKQIIGWDWDGMFEGELSVDAVVMNWRGEEVSIAAAQRGNHVIMTPYKYLYLDYFQSESRQNEPISIGGFLPLSTVYNYEPCTPKLTLQEQKYILGVQANIWMEYIHSESKVDYMTYPRALAAAETGWSPKEKKNYPYFLERLPARLAAMDKAGQLFRIPEPDGWDSVKLENDVAIITLKPLVEGAKIYYTTDGSDPVAKGTEYRGTFRTPLPGSGLNVKCVVTLPSGRSSAIYSLKTTQQ
ncbi:MAG: family 20 glycosylhydrolase [Bacteroidales bacterium]|jgi:hexosaminidase|nr:family 20 glycosylhydrolase [Bacteroidales bacterium]